MSDYFRHLTTLAKKFLLLIILYSLARVFFFIVNYIHFSDIGFPHLLKIFIVGIRFDIAAIVFINAVFFILFLFPGNFRNHQKFQTIFNRLFFMVNAAAILLNFIDAKYFQFIHKRTTSALFSLISSDEDILKLIPRFIYDYWYVALTWIISVFIFHKILTRLKTHSVITRKLSLRDYFLQFAVWICITGLLLLGARGTGLKPISITDAAKYTAVRNVPLLINTPFSLIKTIENSNLKKAAYFEDDKLTPIYSPIHRYDKVGGLKKKNVVIIILESFAGEYIGFLNNNKGYTPFLDSIMKSSVVFENGFANGTQSNEAMPAIIAGIPSLMDTPYNISNYADNAIRGLPYILREKGYYTAFFHGGKNGTMGFDNFAKVAGFEKYYGMNEYPDDKDYDGAWGIWDEPYLQYVTSEINSFKAPFLIAVYTLSSHHPFEVPAGYENKFPEGHHPIIRTIGYTDYALSEFFKTASKMNWFDNTLFVITSDHSAQATDPFYSSNVGMYSIPLFFYSPSEPGISARHQKTAQQIDIMPSILDYLDYSGEFFSFGNNLFDNTREAFAIEYINGIYQLIQGDYVLQFNGKETILFEDWKNRFFAGSAMEKKDRINEDSLRLSMENKLKAVLQTYNSSLINNAMTVE